MTEPSLKSVSKYCAAVSKALGKNKKIPLVLKHAVESVALICYQLNRKPLPPSDPRLVALLNETLSICLALSGQYRSRKSNDQGTKDSLSENIFELEFFLREIVFTLGYSYVSNPPIRAVAELGPSIDSAMAQVSKLETLCTKTSTDISSTWLSTRLYRKAAGSTFRLFQLVRKFGGSLSHFRRQQLLLSVKETLNDHPRETPLINVHESESVLQGQYSFEYLDPQPEPFYGHPSIVFGGAHAVGSLQSLQPMTYHPDPFKEQLSLGSEIIGDEIPANRSASLEGYVPTSSLSRTGMLQYFEPHNEIPNSDTYMEFLGGNDAEQSTPTTTLQLPMPNLPPSGSHDMSFTSLSRSGPFNYSTVYINDPSGSRTRHSYDTSEITTHDVYTPTPDGSIQLTTLKRPSPAEFGTPSPRRSSPFADANDPHSSWSLQPPTPIGPSTAHDREIAKFHDVSSRPLHPIIPPPPTSGSQSFEDQRLPEDGTAKPEALSQDGKEGWNDD